MSKNAIPQIRWGIGNVNTLNFGYPPDNWSAYSEPREGSEYYRTMGGVEDAWITGTDYVLSFDARWIPTNNTTTPLATGWDGPTGFRAFLEWAQAKNSFVFLPDRNGATQITSTLVDPLRGGASLEPDATRTLRLTIRNTTTPYDNY